MQVIPIAVALGTLALVPLAGCQALREEAVQNEAARARVVRGELIEVRYGVPNQEAVAGKSSAARWGLAAPALGDVADPNRIVYDQAYVEKYVHWAVTTPIACGAATYVIVTPQGERSVVSGLDGAHLGQRFRAEELVRFLKTHTAGKPSERTFRVKNAEAVKVLREHPESLAAKRLDESPWDQDTRAIIHLLGLVQYEPAFPLFAALASDANPGVRYEAIVALGRMAGGVPAAIDELEKLLDKKEDRSTAASALAMAGERALPAIVRALDHPDWMVRNHVVHSLGRHADSSALVPALQKVLAHSDSEMREWGVTVVVDLISRGGPEEGKPYVAELAACLLEDANENTRRGAALALLNMKSLAAPAEAALRQAAAKEQNSQGRDFAQRALQGLKAERETQP